MDIIARIKGLIHGELFGNICLHCHHVYFEYEGEPGDVSTYSGGYPVCPSCKPWADKANKRYWDAFKRVGAYIDAETNRVEFTDPTKAPQE